jgi:hypothetical protein
MTYRTLFVVEYPDRESATAPYDREAANQAPTFFLDTDNWGSALWFAKERNLPVDYVDNCWLLVPVNATLAREFLSMVTEADSAVIERIDDERWYGINEEEF